MTMLREARLARGWTQPQLINALLLAAQSAGQRTRRVGTVLAVDRCRLSTVGIGRASLARRLQT